MIRGLDLQNVNSRRAYPLNSRTSWVEQRHHKGSLVYAENRVLGPGEYSPQNVGTMARHISSPTLAQRTRLPQYGRAESRSIDPYDPFNSRLSLDRETHLMHHLGKDRGTGSYTIVDDVALSKHGVSFYERQESATAFHDHDRRVGLDPNRRFCRNEGPAGQGLAHDSLLLAHTTRGVQVPAKVNFGPEDVPFGERGGPVRPALPTYFPNYDSPVVKKSLHLNKIHQSDRRTFIDELLRRQALEDRLSTTAAAARSNSALHAASTFSTLPESESLLLQQHEQAGTRGPSSSSLSPAQGPFTSPVLKPPKPRQKRPAHNLVFDASCYKALAKEQVELNPASIDRLARVGTFNALMAKASRSGQYDSAVMKSKISEKLRRVAL